MLVFVTGLRGVTANIVLLEEASHVNQEMFTKVIVPLLGVEGTVILAISTPDDEFNYYSMLLTATRDGKPLFLTIRIEQSCKDCTSKRLLNCKHRTHLLPKWKSGARQELIEAIMAADPETFARENLGMVIGGHSFIYNKDKVKRLEIARPYTFPINKLPSVVYVGIDPSAGGCSHFAMVACVHHQGNYVVRSCLMLHIHISI